MEKSKLLFLKKGDFKSGTFSKRNACEYSFYEDKIIMTSTSANMIVSKKVIELDEDVMEKLSEWLKGSRLEEEEKNNTMYVDLHEYLYKAIEQHK
jgi:hypothetical protein